MIQDPDFKTSLRKLKAIAQAMQNYADGNAATLPPAFIERDGKPLLSWRVAILPFLLDEKEDLPALYKEFHLDEPWDSEHNQALVARMPDVYRAPKSRLDDGRTTYQTARGRSTVFPGAKAVHFREITDGHSNTIAVVEVADKRAIPWTKPDDWLPTAQGTTAGLSMQYRGGFLAAFVDGHVEWIRVAGNDRKVRNLLTIAGGEPPSQRPR